MKKLFFIFLAIFIFSFAFTTPVFAEGEPGQNCENAGNVACGTRGCVEDITDDDGEPMGYVCGEDIGDDEDEPTPTATPTEAPSCRPLDCPSPGDATKSLCNIIPGSPTCQWHASTNRCGCGPDRAATPSPTPLPEGRTNNLCSGEDKQICNIEGYPQLDCSAFDNYICNDSIDQKTTCFCTQLDSDKKFVKYIGNACRGGIQSDIGTRYISDTRWPDESVAFGVKSGHSAILSIRDIDESNIKYTVRECSDFVPRDSNTCPIVDEGFGTEVPVSCEIQNGIPKPQETFIKFEKVEGGGTGGGACGGNIDFEPLCNATNTPKLKARWHASPLRGEDTCNIYIRAGERDYTVSHECTSTGVTFTQLTDIEDGETLALEQDSGPYQLWVSNGVDDETNAESCLDEQVSETMLACSATPSPTTTPPPGATRTPTSRPGSATATPRPRGPTPTPAPTLDKRNITATCTGGKFTLDWGPVVGAGGYKVQLFDVTSGITPTPVRTPRDVPVTGTHAETTATQGRSYNWLLAVTDARGVEDDRKGSERVNIFCPVGAGAVSPTTTPIPTIPPEDTALLTKIGVTETSSKCVDVQGVTNYSIKDTQTDTYTPLGQIDITGDGTTTQADRDRLAQTIQKLPEGDPRLCSSRPQ